VHSFKYAGMRKCVFFFCGFVLLLFLGSYGFSFRKVKVPHNLVVCEPTEMIYPQRQIALNAPLVAPPFLGSSYIGFKEALAFKESSGDYFRTNTLGYLGKYQFGIGTLQLMGVYNASRFLNDPVLQEKVFYTNLSRNKWILRKDILRYEGKRIGGITITESGMLAAAHLAGPGNVKKYLRSWGRTNKMDAYGTQVSNYLQKFSGYDVSYVAPARNPKILM